MDFCKECEMFKCHTHEYLGSTEIVKEKKEEPHNHRFAGVTGPAIRCSDNPKHHFHKFKNNTDFFEDHFHKMEERTGIEIDVGDGRHVHYACGETNEVDCHDHNFRFATLIENPIGKCD